MIKLTTDEIITRLVACRDADERQSLYQQWASTYDQDLSDYGYVAPLLSVNQFCKAVTDQNALIYDAGCGTGLIGSLLRDRGYLRLHGADVSPAMLAQAKLTNNYSDLAIADYTLPLPIEDNTYDAIISVGVYTALFEKVFISEMLRILKPEGLLYFTCRPQYFETSVGMELQQLLTEQIVESVIVERKPYMLKQNAEAFYVLIRPKLNQVEE